MAPASSPAVEGDSKTKKLAAVPKIALKALEPQDGGDWAFSGQTGDAFSLSYIMNDGSGSVAYNMLTCTTEDEVRANCSKYIYDMAPAGLGPHHAQNPDHEIVSLVNSGVASPQPANPILHHGFYGPNLATQTQQTLSPHQNGGHNRAFSNTAAPMPTPAESLSNSTQPVQQFASQRTNGAGAAMFEQGNLATPLTSGGIDFTFNHGFPPALEEHVTNNEFSQILDADIEDPFNTTMMDGVWNQFGGKEVWDNTMFNNL